MVPLNQKQFDRDPAIASQFGGIRGDRHSLLDRSRTSRKEPLGSRDLHQADPAGPHIRETVKGTQGGNELATSLCSLEDGLAFQRADQLSVDSD